MRCHGGLLEKAAGSAASASSPAKAQNPPSGSRRTEKTSPSFLARGKQLGAEADGKFFDFEMQQLSRGVVAELVHGDHGEQDEQRKQHRADGAQHVRRGE